MKAAVLTGLRDIQIRDVPAPRIERDDEVLIRVDTVGVCGSDMHYYRFGRIGSQVMEFPCTIGHEFAGTIAEAAPAVTNVKAGDRVAVDPLIPCNRCDQCLDGRKHTCRDQSFLGCPGEAGGAMVEYIVMPGECCLPVGPDVTMNQAALVEPFSIAVYAQRLAGDTAGKTVAILGAGPIGLSVLLALKHGGAGVAYVTDLLVYRCQLAADLGADWTGNADSIDADAEILSREPLGVDLAYECAGTQETLDQCARLLKPGGTLMIVGISADDRSSFDMNVMRRKELSVQNVRRQNECLAGAVGMVQNGEVNLDPLATHDFTLEQSAEAYDLVADYRDNVVKAMIHVS